jgi:hypothetical protein
MPLPHLFITSPLGGWANNTFYPGKIICQFIQQLSLQIAKSLSAKKH